ncbi:MAG TPA: DUF1269 domain-containing protein [Acetobacteraceae bacterium]
MPDLLVIVYSTERKAVAVRRTLLDMRQEYLVEPDDAVIATKCAPGQVRLNRLFHPLATGAASGLFWSCLIGMLFLVPLADTGWGAPGGRLKHLGIDGGFLTEAGKALQSGNAVLFLLIRMLTTGKVLAALRGSGARILRTSLEESKQAALQEALAGLRSVIAASGQPRQS